MDEPPGNDADESDPAEATGLWWVNPWWEAKDCDILFTVPREAVTRGASVLSNYFDAAWYRDLAANPRRQMIFPKLRLERSTVALEFIASFGARLERLDGTPNLLRAVRAMKETDGEAAFFELEAAEAFAEWGFRVSFPKEGGNSSPDVIAEINDQTIALECKHLKDEDWERWESDLLRDLSFALPTEAGGKQLAVQVALEPRLTDVRFGGGDVAEINKAISDVIKTTIMEAINEALEDGRLPVKIEILEIATVFIQENAPDATNSVSGVHRSALAMFRRIFQNGVFRALVQLPKGTPGVAVIYSKHAPPPAVFRLFYDAMTSADPKRFSDLAGILICTQQTWFDRPRPIFYANTHTRHPDAARAIADTLRKSFRAEAG